MNRFEALNKACVLKFGPLLVAALATVLTGFLTGCAVPTAPPRAVVYDFGPGALPLAQAAGSVVAALPALPALSLVEVEAPSALDTTAVLYRLGYADAQVLRPYAQARWSMPPAQLLRQRLREHLGVRRAVLNTGEGTGASPSPRLLRIEIEEFSQVFESASASSGLLRLRATVVQPSPQGDKLLGQRAITVQRPAPSLDASGGVRALTAATDAAIAEVDAWLQQLR